MEPWNLSAVQVLINVSISHPADLVRRCGLRRASWNNRCHKWVSGPWVEPLISSLHMPRRRHQEHGSSEHSIQVLGANTTGNKNQHGALRPLSTRAPDHNAHSPFGWVCQQVWSQSLLKQQLPQISVRSMGWTVRILPSHASTKTSRTWKFGAFYPNAWNKYCWK